MRCKKNDIGDVLLAVLLSQKTSIIVIPTFIKQPCGAPVLFTSLHPLVEREVMAVSWNCSPCSFVPHGASARFELCHESKTPKVPAWSSALKHTTMASCSTLNFPITYSKYGSHSHSWKLLLGWKRKSWMVRLLKVTLGHTEVWENMESDG